MKRLSENPNLDIPELNKMFSNEKMTCRACYEGELSRAPHRKKVHNYERRQELSSDIMGPIQVPGIPQEVEK